MEKFMNERICYLRKRSHMTQTDLALRMNVTRSGVNAWEMGISKPTLDNLTYLSKIFHTTTDYLLGIEQKEVITLTHISSEEKELILQLIHYIESRHR